MSVVCNISGILLIVTGIVRYIIGFANGRGGDDKVPIWIGIGIALLLVPGVINGLHAEVWIP